MEGTIGEVRLFGGNFAPRNWALCQGQLLPISGHQALFSIIGTLYGGDGRKTFALPDLRGRSPIAPGRGPGLSTIREGQRMGVETVTLTVDQLPAHSHTAVSQANASGGSGDQAKPANNLWAGNRGQLNFGSTSPTQAMATNAVTTSIGNTGSNQAHENRPPQLGINFIICLEGIFPSRS